MTTIIALIGPPCSGKSTITEMLEDLGVPCMDTGDAIRRRTEERIDDPTEDDYWKMASTIREDHGPEGPTAICEGWIDGQVVDGSDVVCVSSLRDEEELEWLRERYESVLSVGIWAPYTERLDRYIDREVDMPRRVVDRDEIEELRNELSERENREAPYPPTDVKIHNTNGTSMTEVQRDLQNLVGVLE